METRLSLTVTFLEQLRPEKPAKPQPLPYCLKDTVTLQCWQPDITAYRALYSQVGKPYLWWERLVLSDQELTAILSDPATEFYQLLDNDVRIGFCEITMNSAPATCNIAYFGFIPSYEQRGLGGKLMRQMLAHIWHSETKPARVTVNTCTLDHPKALGFYQHLGFATINQEEMTILDPREMPALSSWYQEG